MKSSKKGNKKPFFSKKRIIILIIVLVALVATFVVICMTKKDDKGGENNAQTQVERRDIVATITGTAVVEPNEEYSVTSLVNGDIISANFEEGDYVSEGDVLYQLDAQDVKNNIASADVAIERAQNDYADAIRSKNNIYVKSEYSGIIKTIHVKEGDSVQSGAPIADLYDNSSMELTVPFNVADLSNIRVGSDASVNIVGTNDSLTGKVSHINNASYTKSGNMSVCDVTILVKNPGTIMNESKATAAVNGVYCNDVGEFKYINEKTITSKSAGTVERINIKEGNRVSAGAVVAELDNDAVVSNVKSSALSLEDSKINKTKTESQLDDYTIKAPISGKIISKNAKVGDKLDITTSQEPMAVIYDMTTLKFELMVDELDINKIAIGQEVKITADALNEKEYMGSVTKISIDGIEEKGVTSYPVTVTIYDFDENLLPGMNIDAEIAVGNANNVLAIPKSAVTRDNLVYVQGEKDDLSDNAPEGYKSVQVETGLNDGYYIEIISGLSESDIVKIDVINNDGGGMMENMPKPMQMMQGAR